LTGPISLDETGGLISASGGFGQDGEDLIIQAGDVGVSANTGGMVEIDAGATLTGNPTIYLGKNTADGIVNMNGVLELESATPTFTIENTTAEDSDGGRESQIIANGKQSGFEVTSLGMIEFSHDGAGDDEKGKITIQTNNDGALADAIILNSVQDVKIPVTLTLATGASVDNIETTLTDDDTHLPTSGAVYGAISALTKTGVYRTQDMDSGAFVPRTTNGPAIASTESTTNKVMNEVYDFDPDADEFIQVKWAMPDVWDKGTVKIKFYWTASSGSGDVIWGAQAVALGNDDAIDTAFGTAQVVTDTLITALDVHTSSATASITVSGTPVLGDIVYFQIYRDADAGGDTLAVDARLLKVVIQYKESTTEPSAW